MVFRDYLNKVVNNIDLNKEEIAHVMMQVFSGNVTDAQIGAFIGALATKGETFEELAGAATAMRRKGIRIETSVPTILDICGTGGDGAQTFNISTTAAFVVAGCGVTVAKHGDRSTSSHCGSADLLETLGVNLDTDPEIVEKAIEAIGIGFLYAPIYHSAMRFAAQARKEVGLQSIFNMLGPLTNPAAANCQVLGVYAPELTEMYAKALKLLGSKHAFVVHGYDGCDEISVCAATRVSELNGGQIRTYDIYPEEYFENTAAPEDIKGGDLTDNAEITLSILKGEKGPRRNVVLLNSGAALVVAGITKEIQEGIRIAENAIDNGAAMEKLDQIIQYTRGKG